MSRVLVTCTAEGWSLHWGRSVLIAVGLGAPLFVAFVIAALGLTS